MPLYHTPNRVYGDFTVYQLPDTSKVLFAANEDGVSLGYNAPTVGAPLQDSFSINMRAGYWDTEPRYTDAAWYHVPTSIYNSKLSLKFNAVEQMSISDSGFITTPAGLSVGNQTVIHPNGFGCYVGDTTANTDVTSTTATHTLGSSAGYAVLTHTDTSSRLDLRYYDLANTLSLLSSDGGPAIDFVSTVPGLKLSFRYNGTDIGSLGSTGIFSVTTALTVGAGTTALMDTNGLQLPTYVTATLPAASIAWNRHFAYYKNPGAAGELLFCRETAAGGYEWITVGF